MSVLVGINTGVWGGRGGGGGSRARTTVCSQRPEPRIRIFEAAGMVWCLACWLEPESHSPERPAQIWKSEPIQGLNNDQHRVWGHLGLYSKDPQSTSATHLGPHITPIPFHENPSVTRLVPREYRTTRAPIASLAQKGW